MNKFEAEVVAAIAVLGPAGLRRLADQIESRGGAGPGHGETGKAAGAVGRVLDALADATLAVDASAAYLRGVAAGYEQRAAQVSAETVWTGPRSFDVPVRATVRVLTGLVDEARREIILTTYSAKPYPTLANALREAVTRGVSVWIVVETLHGAGSAMQGEQPAAAFADVTGTSLWTWAIDQRPKGAKMHAKAMVVDERALFVSSANLTVSGIDSNIEAGILVRGGTAARRAAEHLWTLRRDGVLVRI